MAQLSHAVPEHDDSSGHNSNVTRFRENVPLENMVASKIRGKMCVALCRKDYVTCARLSWLFIIQYISHTLNMCIHACVWTSVQDYSKFFYIIISFLESRFPLYYLWLKRHTRETAGAQIIRGKIYYRTKYDYNDRVNATKSCTKFEDRWALIQCTDNSANALPQKKSCKVWE